MPDQWDNCIEVDNSNKQHSIFYRPYLPFTTQSAIPSGTSAVGNGEDTDGDGFGDACDGDFNNDGAVMIEDFLIWRDDYDTGVDSGIGSDMNSDGVVDDDDLDLMLQQLANQYPGP